ncbi:unnamed protein product [Leptosia nina]|uniref:Uncharacterized protein n=1 Tax=Leptosia nina TaxID=320188 RepID=A0AAV1K3I4_9NEOP
MHAARAPGVVVMSWWWTLAVLVVSQPVRAAPRAATGEIFYSYQMSRKSCVAGGARGACMWVQECNRVGGKHAGVCVDGFMFGSCCRLPEKPIVIEESQSPITITERPFDIAINRTNAGPVSASNTNPTPFVHDKTHRWRAVK